MNMRKLLNVSLERAAVISKLALPCCVWGNIWATKTFRGILAFNVCTLHTSTIIINEKQISGYEMDSGKIMDVDMKVTM